MTLCVAFVLLAQADDSLPREVPSGIAADLIFTNGNIRTLDPAQPVVQSVAVLQGRIIHAGDAEAGEAFANEQTKRIDLRGATLMPGLTDAHVHAAWGEFLLRRLCYVQSYNNEDGLARLARCAEQAPPGDWVVAYGWYVTDNPGLSEVRLADLDAIEPKRKLVVISRDHHTFWFNSRMIEYLGITRETPDPPGGSYGRDPVTGELDGTARDGGNVLATQMVHTESSYAADNFSLYQTALPYLNSMGVTSLVEAMVDDDAEAALRELDARGELTMNVSMAFRIMPGNYRSEIPRIAAKRVQPGAHTRIDYIKVFADGNLEDGLAFMLGADGNPAEGSEGYFTQEQMNEVVMLAEQNGLSVFVHVIGDAAARQVLDAIAAARQRGACANCTHTLTHMQWVHPDDLQRMAELGVIANIQESWIAPRVFGGPPGYDYVRWLGSSATTPAIAESMFPFRSLHEAGARLAAGSDWFFTEVNPWQAIAMGATSRDVRVPGEAPMLPKQTLDIPTLLEARIAGGAYQMRDPLRGSISVGKAADFVVTDRDPWLDTPEGLAAIQVISTWLEGRQVWPRQP